MSYPKLNMVEGRSYRFVRAEGHDGFKHMHWGWKVGEVYVATRQGDRRVYELAGPLNHNGEIPQVNWGGWVFEEVVEPVVARIEWSEVVEARNAYDKAHLHFIETLSAYQVQESVK